MQEIFIIGHFVRWTNKKELPGTSTFNRKKTHKLTSCNAAPHDKTCPHVWYHHCGIMYAMTKRYCKVILFYLVFFLGTQSITVILMQISSQWQFEYVLHSFFIRNQYKRNPGLGMLNFQETRRWDPGNPDSMIQDRLNVIFMVFDKFW